MNDRLSEGMYRSLALQRWTVALAALACVLSFAALMRAHSAAIDARRAADRHIEDGAYSSIESLRQDLLRAGVIDIAPPPEE